MHKTPQGDGFSTSQSCTALGTDDPSWYPSSLPRGNALFFLPHQCWKEKEVLAVSSDHTSGITALFQQNYKTTFCSRGFLQVRNTVTLSDSNRKLERNPLTSHITPPFSSYMSFILTVCLPSPIWWYSENTPCNPSCSPVKICPGTHWFIDSQK